MWNRKALKRQGKAAFKRNYWKCLLAALILTVAAAGAGFSSGAFSGSHNKTSVSYSIDSNSEDENAIDGWEYKEDFQGGQNQSFFGNGSSGGNGSSSSGNSQMTPFGSSDGSSSGNSQMSPFGSSDGSSSSGNSQMTPFGSSDGSSSSGNSQMTPFGNGSGSNGGGYSYGFGENAPEMNQKDTSAKTGVFAVIGGILAGLAAIVLYLLYRIFIGNPLEAGSKRFFLMNLKADPAEAKEIAYPFDHSWKNVGKVLFFRDLYTFLWGLLFIVPGIIKFYQYRLIPFILAENPEMDKKSAFELSKNLMHGHKWDCFVLDLSFIGWYLLSAITLGIVGLFYANPYIYSTEAAMYAFIRYEEPSHRYYQYQQNSRNYYDPYQQMTGAGYQQAGAAEAAPQAAGAAEAAPQAAETAARQTAGEPAREAETAARQTAGAQAQASEGAAEAVNRAGADRSQEADTAADQNLTDRQPVEEAADAAQQEAPDRQAAADTAETEE